MKILVPLNDANYLSRYIDAGADEFYLGFYDNTWIKRFGKYSDINRMSGFGALANKYNFEQAIEISKQIKSYNRSVFLTLNANNYSISEIDYICSNYFPKIKNSDIDGIIVSGIGLAKLAVTNGIQPVASTMCGIYNSDIADIYIKCGIKRLIIPRDVSLNEIMTMCKKHKDAEYEVFFMRNGCIFSDSYCLGMHRPECGSFCGFVRSVPKEIYSTFYSFKELHDIEVNDYLYNKAFHHYACGMCALYRLNQAGITSLKIVGRADQQMAIENDIRLTKENIKILNACASEEEYLEKMIFPKEGIRNCKLGYSCYYPEVRFNE